MLDFIFPKRAQKQFKEKVLFAQNIVDNYYWHDYGLVITKDKDNEDRFLLLSKRKLSRPEIQAIAKEYGFMFVGFLYYPDKTHKCKNIFQYVGGALDE